ncbi:MAG: hypothetical protein ACJ8AT_06195 [Hyalangium sp.]|uniref:hypothetical protein n=1 Tax=Hyalangium sp. TaxID=2028555 RepID=UPI00389A52AD
MKATLCGALGALLLVTTINSPRAYAQAIASGGAVNVLAALLGQDVRLKSLTCTATSGNACVKPSVLGSKVCFDPSCATSVYSDGSAAILPENVAVNALVTAQISAPGSFVRLVSNYGVTLPTVTSVPTCGPGGSDSAATLVVQPASGPSRVCYCAYDSSSGTYAWEHVGGSLGTTTSCPTN